jgi:chromosome partitioning protein
MTILGVVSQKGGVGKTTIALNLALAFARRGVTTLLVDVDPQGGIGNSLQGRVREAGGIEAILAGREPFEQSVLSTREPNLTLLPIGKPPWAALPAFVAKLGEPQMLGALLGHAEKRYSLVLVDTPSGLYGPTYAVMQVASHLLLALQTEPLALRSVPQLLEVLSAVKGRGGRASLLGVCLTMASFREEVSLAVSQEAWTLFPQNVVLDTHIPKDTALVRASAKGVPIALLRKSPPPVSMVFDHLAAELDDRLRGRSEGAGSDDEAISLLD